MSKTNLNIVDQPNADPVVDRVEAAAAAASDDPFDLSNLRLTQDFVETAGVKKLLRTCPLANRIRRTSFAFIRIPTTGWSSR
jgi:hypothetical protein